MGKVPEWTKGIDCKSIAYCFVGSNPALPILLLTCPGLVGAIGGTSNLDFEGCGFESHTGRFVCFMALLAQLVDAQDSKSWGYWFDSSTGHLQSTLQLSAQPRWILIMVDLRTPARIQ